MKLTARLAYSQLKINKRRTIWTLVGIILSTAIISAVYGLGFGTGLDFVDRIWGDSPFISTYYQTITWLAIILSIFILSISVVVVSNAFRVSAGERMMQFGILKSTGATQRQITQTVVYEGLFLTLIGIPLGMIIGLILHIVGVVVINHYVVLIDGHITEDYLLRFIVSPLSLFLSAAVSLITVMLSAWIPANKAAKISAINAIRGSGEVNVKNKKVWLGGLTQKIFKTEGMLANKFLKRSKRNFRATVISISFSVILFVATGALFTQLDRATDLAWAGHDHPALLMAVPYNNWIQDEDGRWIAIPRERDATLDEFFEITERLQNFVAEGETVFGIGIEDGYAMTITDDWLTSQAREAIDDMFWFDDEPQTMLSVGLTIVNRDIYAELVQLADVPFGSNILINYAQHRFEDGRRAEFRPFNFSMETLTLERMVWNHEEGGLETISEKEVEIHGQLTGSDVPRELHHILRAWTMTIIVPEANVDSFEWLSDTEDLDAFFDYAAGVFEPFVEEQILRFNTNDNREEIEQMQNMMRLMMILVFGFVGILTAIGLTNVISTISENVRTRAKEFAVLQSVGMTRVGIKRMLAMEAVFCSIKALLIGLPIGVLASYGLFHAVALSATFDYELPWLPIGLSVIAVFIITWLTMRYAANKLKNRNIIETIRSGSGM